MPFNFHGLEVKKISSFFSLEWYSSFPKIWIFYPFFLQKSKKLDFPWKIFWRRKLPFGNSDDFFRIDFRSTNIHSGDFSNISRDFRILFRFFFFYEARRFTVFQPTCRKCMSSDSSILPVSESVPFKKQMRIFNANFEKNRSILPTHYAAIFLIPDFCSWLCGSRHFVLRSFARMQKKEFLKKLHKLSRYQLF